MVGNTPLLALRLRLKTQEHRIYAKAEFLNLTGSIKDRMALHVLQAAYREGRIRAVDTIAEASEAYSPLEADVDESQDNARSHNGLPFRS
jgi:cysteine synthase